MPAPLVGVKVRSKVVLPPAVTLVAGTRVTRKAPALAPLNTTAGFPLRVSARLPLFRMVKARLLLPPFATVPKSVSLAVLTVVEPLAMDRPLPCRSISAPVPVPWMAKV